MKYADTQLDVTAAELCRTPMGRSLLAGRLVVTAVSAIDGTHVTLRFSCKRPPAAGGRWEYCPFAEAKRVYVDVPGSDLSPGDAVGSYDRQRGRLWYERGADPRRVNAAVYALLSAAGRIGAGKLLGGDAAERDRLADEWEAAGENAAELLPSIPCFTCGRSLTDPESIRRGQGPKCYGAETGSSHQRKGESFDVGAALPADYDAVAASLPAADAIFDDDFAPTDLEPAAEQAADDPFADAVLEPVA